MGDKRGLIWSELTGVFLCKFSVENCKYWEGGGSLALRQAKQKRSRGGVPPIFLQVVAGLRVLCEFMAFGRPFGACSARCAGEVWTGAEAPRSLRFEVWIRGLPPIRDETADGWGTRQNIPQGLKPSLILLHLRHD